MLRGLEGWHIVILAVVVGVLFGYKRMPEAARSMGRSMRIFKSEVDTMRKDEPADPPRPDTDPVDTGSARTTAPATIPSDPVSGPLRVDPGAPTPAPAEARRT